jgi:hypothetical protein
VSLYYLQRSAISASLIRFRHLTKELSSSVTPFLLCEGCLDRFSRDDLKLLFDPQREDVVVFYLIVDHRAPPDEHQGNLSCIFTTSLSPEQYAVVVLVVDLISAIRCHSVGFGTANQMPLRIGYAEHFNCSHNAVIRVYDAVGILIETLEHKGDFKEPWRISSMPCGGDLFASSRAMTNETIRLRGTATYSPKRYAT